MTTSLTNRRSATPAGRIAKAGGRSSAGGNSEKPASPSKKSVTAKSSSPKKHKGPGSRRSSVSSRASAESEESDADESEKDGDGESKSGKKSPVSLTKKRKSTESKDIKDSNTGLSVIKHLSSTDEVERELDTELRLESGSKRLFGCRPSTVWWLFWFSAWISWAFFSHHDVKCDYTGACFQRHVETP